MKSKHVMLVSIVLAGLVGLMGYGYMVQQNPKAFLVFAVGSQPDIYGNKIYYAIVYQNRGGTTWSNQIDYGDYQSGMTIDIIANYPTWIAVAVLINTTLCPSGIGEADDLTRVYISVSGGVKTNELMDWDVTWPSPEGFYRVLYACTSWTPATSVVYTITLNYQAYY